MGKIGKQALIAGILSILLFFFITYQGGMATFLINLLVVLAAIILGIIGIVKADSKSEKIQSIIGLLLGSLTVIIGLSLFLIHN